MVKNLSTQFELKLLWADTNSEFSQIKLCTSFQFVCKIKMECTYIRTYMGMAVLAIPT